jgi:peroxiredoxin
MLRKLLIFIPILAFIGCTNTGKKLPSFSLQTVDGKTITEQDLKGKITVIDVWATWCPNCLQERLELNILADMYKQDTSLVFLAISEEEPERIAAFLARNPFNFTHLLQGEKFTDLLQTQLVKTYPQHIVVDKDLNIVYERSSELNQASVVLSKEIERLR